MRRKCMLITNDIKNFFTKKKYKKKHSDRKYQSCIYFKTNIIKNLKLIMLYKSKKRTMSAKCCKLRLMSY